MTGHSLFLAGVGLLAALAVLSLSAAVFRCPLFHQRVWTRYGDGDSETVHCPLCRRTWRRPR